MQWQGPVQPGIDVDLEAYRQGNVTESLGVRNEGNIEKSVKFCVTAG